MNEISPVVFERAMESLRQERETFDQHKAHENRWFLLRLVRGYSSVVLLAAIMILCAYILCRSKEFSTSVVASAGAALFGDVLGLLVGVWKVALNPSFVTRLSPVTSEDTSGPRKARSPGASRA